MEPNTRLEQYACVSLKDNLIFDMVDDKHLYFSRSAIVPSGKHTISVHYSKSGSYSRSYTLSPIVLGHVFEPGKFYVVDFKLPKNASGGDIVSAFIEESGGPDAKLLADMDKVRTFAASMSASSAGIDGTYALETDSRVMKMTAPNFITLDNFNFVSHDQPEAANSKNVKRGVFLLNDNWLILFYHSLEYNPGFLAHADVRYIRQGDHLLLQNAADRHTFMPWALKYKKIK